MTEEVVIITLDQTQQAFVDKYRNIESLDEGFYLTDCFHGQRRSGRTEAVIQLALDLVHSTEDRITITIYTYSRTAFRMAETRFRAKYPLLLVSSTEENGICVDNALHIRNKYGNCVVEIQCIDEGGIIHGDESVDLAILDGLDGEMCANAYRVLCVQ